MVPLLVAVEPFSPSVEVAVSVRVYFPTRRSSDLMVRPASCAGVSVQEPPPLSMPADRVAPLGTPEMVIESVSERTGPDCADGLDSGIALSSLQDAAATVSVG